MNLKSVCLLSLVVLFSGVHGVAQDTPADGYRHWTTSDGTRSSVRLKLVDSDRNQVRLQREDNGRVIVMAKSKLSSADRAYLGKMATASKQSAAGLSTSAASPSAIRDDWPQWRGPNRDGKSPATGLLKQWAGDGPTLLWNVSGLGEGYSTPAVVGDVVYLLGTRGNNEFVFARSVKDGSEVWQSEIGTKGGGGGFPGPKGTPTVEEDRIYAIGSQGTLVCVNRADGKTIWQKNFERDFQGQHGHWEYAESPLIDGEKLICTPGGAQKTLVALRKSNGAPIWQSPVGQLTTPDFSRAAYASTIVATIAGTRQYIAFVHGGVIGVEANRGVPLWHYDAPANDTANCSTPVVHDDSVFAASAYGTGGGRANITRRGNNWNVNETYFVNKMESHHGGFVLHEGHIYGTNNSVLMCLDWQTGAIKWQERCVGKGSITLADGHLIVRGERGDVALVEATPQAYREKGRFSQPDRSDKNAWPHPVIAGGRLYLHDQDRLLCYDLRE